MERDCISYTHRRAHERAHTQVHVRRSCLSACVDDAQCRRTGGRKPWQGCLHDNCIRMNRPVASGRNGASRSRSDPVAGIEVGRPSRDAGAVGGNSLQRGRCRVTAGAWSSPWHGRVADITKGPANRSAGAKKSKEGQRNERPRGRTNRDASGEEESESGRTRRADICNSNSYNIVHNIIQYARVSQLLLQYVQYNNIEQYHTILKTIL